MYTIYCIQCIIFNILTYSLLSMAHSGVYISVGQPKASKQEVPGST